ncbi:hypothetical protein Q1695_000865 [Nippostrongylus brasiliensis]|nr:hypothetical protein Q1695_000865 [Nippostrongylus brasiliensis]
MDADLLRSILDAQAVQQQKALNAVMDRMERMFAAVTGSPTAAPATTTEFITNSLSTRLPAFCYDPDSGCTFDVWYSRYEDIISKDGSTLDDAAKVRLIVSKLDARFTNHIRPYKTSDIPLEDTVKTLKQLFGHNASVFSRRYSYLRTQRNGESLLDYTGTVNLRHDIAEFNDVTPEQMKCLVWICGLVAPEDADIRARALRKMEDNPMTTLKELNAEIQQFVNIRHDVKLLEGQPSPLLHAVNSVVKNDSKRDIPHSRTTRDPPSPCFRCGGHHWAKDCQFINKPCHECKLVGHKRGFCKNFTKRKRTTPKKKPRTANTVTVASNSSQRNNSARLTHGNRIYRNVQIHSWA